MIARPGSSRCLDELVDVAPGGLARLLRVVSGREADAEERGGAERERRVVRAGPGHDLLLVVARVDRGAHDHGVVVARARVVRVACCLAHVDVEARVLERRRDPGRDLRRVPVGAGVEEEDGEPAQLPAVAAGMGPGAGWSRRRAAVSASHDGDDEQDRADADEHEAGDRGDRADGAPAPGAQQRAAERLAHEQALLLARRAPRCRGRPWRRR